MVQQPAGEAMEKNKRECNNWWAKKCTDLNLRETKGTHTQEKQLP
jgi:hypothetical protein